MHTTYIWQKVGWPHLLWDAETVSAPLAEVNRLRGELLGKASMFGLEERNLSMLESLTQEITHSAMIEGEELSRDSVRSSVARQLGIECEGLTTPDHYTEGVVQVMLDAVQHHGQPLSAERLFAWHTALFPMGRSGMHKIDVGQWRVGDEPMQVVSGAMGHERVHYEAPASSDVPAMMDELIGWVNADDVADPVVKAALAHLWFVTIHPFDDGNGRLCRTLTEMLLSRADHTSHRYYSLSSEILNHRKEYYEHLEQAQKGNLDVTQWVLWFLQVLAMPVRRALDRMDSVVRKVRFWDAHRTVLLNDRQRKVLNRLLDGFEGKLTSSKWYKINHCSQDTANRDIHDLLAKGILERSPEGGRSTSYHLAEWDTLPL